MQALKQSLLRGCHSGTSGNLERLCEASVGSANVPQPYTTGAVEHPEHVSCALQGCQVDTQRIEANHGEGPTKVEGQKPDGAICMPPTRGLPFWRLHS